MSTKERMFNAGIGLVFAAVAGVITRHLVSPSYITTQLVAAVLVPVAMFLGFMAYDSFKEALTGTRQ